MCEWNSIGRFFGTKLGPHTGLMAQTDVLSQPVVQLSSLEWSLCSLLQLLCLRIISDMSSFLSPLYAHSVTTSSHWYGTAHAPPDVVTATRSPLSPNTPTQQYLSTATGKDLSYRNGQVPTSTASSAQSGCSEATSVRPESWKWPPPSSTKFHQHQAKAQGDYNR